MQGDLLVPGVWEQPGWHSKPLSQKKEKKQERKVKEEEREAGKGGRQLGRTCQSSNLLIFEVRKKRPREFQSHLQSHTVDFESIVVKMEPSSLTKCDLLV